MRNALTQHGQSLTLRAFLDEHFAESKAQQRTLITNALESTETTIDPRATERPTRTRWIPLAAAVLIGIAAAGWYALDGREIAEPPSFKAAAVALTDAKSSTRVVDTSTTTDETSLPDDVPVAAEETSEREETSRAEILRARRIRRAQLRRRRRRTSPSPPAEEAGERPSSRFWGWP